MLGAKEKLRVQVVPESEVDNDSYVHLKDKHDALKQHFRILELEKQEYETEINKLRAEQSDLIEECEHNRSESRDYERMSQPLSASLSIMTTALNTADTMRELATDKNLEYEVLIDSLEQQKTELNEENKQYIETVETLRSNVNRTELDYQNKIQQLTAQIAHINEEYEAIEDKYEAKVNEYDALKRKHDKELMTQMEVATPARDAEAVPAFYAPYMRTLSHHDIQTISRQISNQKLQFAMIHDMDSRISLPYDNHETDRGLHHTHLESEEDSDIGSDLDHVPLSNFMQQPMIKDEKDTQVFIVNMMKTMHQKDLQIEQLITETQSKSEQIQTLNALVTKLKTQLKQITTIVRDMSSIMIEE